MKDISQRVWERAIESLGDATANEREERYLVTVNRSYYAAFYGGPKLLPYCGLYCLSLLFKDYHTIS